MWVVSGLKRIGCRAHAGHDAMTCSKVEALRTERNMAERQRDEYKEALFRVEAQREEYKMAVAAGACQPGAAVAMADESGPTGAHKPGATGAGMDPEKMEEAVRCRVCLDLVSLCPQPIHQVRVPYHVLHMLVTFHA